MTRWSLRLALLLHLSGCGSESDEKSAGEFPSDAGAEDAAAPARPDAGSNADAQNALVEPSCDVMALFGADGLSGLGCTGAICHGVGGTPPDFKSEGLAERLRDQPAAEDGVCAGELLIDSAHPERSLLLTKLGDAPPCGSPMPLTNRSALMDADRVCIAEYVRFVAAGGVGE